MPDYFSYNVRVEQPVEPAMMEAFSDLMPPLQSAMVRIAHEHSKLKVKCEELEKENGRLRAHNQSLSGEVSRLNSELSTYRDGSTRGPAPPSRETNEPFELVRSISVHSAPVHSVTMGPATHPDTPCDIVATASWDSTVKLYSLTKGQVVQSLGEDQPDGTPGQKMQGLYSVAFAKTNPEILGCTSYDKSIYLWNHKTGRMLQKLTGHTHEVNDIDFHDHQQVIVTASDDASAIVWDYHEGMQLRKLDKHTKSVYGATFLGGTEFQFFVATCCFDLKTRVFDMRDKQVTAMLHNHEDDVIGIDYAPAKHCLATSSDDGLICLYDVRTWKLTQKIDTKQGGGVDASEVKRIAFSPDGNSLAAASSSGRVLVYDVNLFPAPQLAALAGHTECAFDVAWGVCPETNARLLVSASHDHTSRCWREVL